MIKQKSKKEERKDQKANKEEKVITCRDTRLASRASNEKIKKSIPRHVLSMSRHNRGSAIFEDYDHAAA